ncbi:BglG family transcription antiterminator [Lacticaseibacillus parakribbianus]|uniref:BglG family transcription antiterminator n=1 Tax=Lacticaseibacillus parakribbianus TaxID=2970927 RepID=UPI0021CB8961|nr:BglG family transcription antiterminator [Lacticaseibacillus parakribbianus]
MLDAKQILIIDALIQSPTQGKAQLQSALDLTGRQVDYAIEKLNQLLAGQKLPQLAADGPAVTLAPQAYRYLLDLRTTDRLIRLDTYALNADERQLFLTLMLACHGEYLALVHLTDALQVSQSTISKDLKALSASLKSSHLSISYDRQNGYRLTGSERNIRAFLMDVIVHASARHQTGLLRLFAKLIQPLDRLANLRLLRDLAGDHGIPFTEHRLLELNDLLLFLVGRLRLAPNYLPRGVDGAALVDLPEHRFAQALLAALGITQPVAVQYVTLLVLCLASGTAARGRIDDQLRPLATHLVRRYAAITMTHFADEAAVVAQLYSHFRGMYFRLRFNYPVANPLTAQVKAAYPKAFAAVASVCSDRTEVGLVPPAEVAYLTMHLVAASRGVTAPRPTQPTAAFYCPSGLGVGQLALRMLTTLFPNLTFRAFTSLPALEAASFDLIFTTSYTSRLYLLNKPCFVVSPLMAAADKHELVQHVNAHLAATVAAAPSLDAIMAVIADTVPDPALVARLRQKLRTSLF